MRAKAPPKRLSKRYKLLERLEMARKLQQAGEHLRSSLIANSHYTDAHRVRGELLPNSHLMTPDTRRAFGDAVARLSHKLTLYHQLKK